MKRIVLACVLALPPLFLSGCQSTYYSAMEKVGIHKRDILVDRVEDTRAAQDDAQEEFVSALEQFRTVVNFDGGELESVYNDMQSAYDDSEAAAESVSDNIRKVEDVAEALFDEWQEELGQYTNTSCAVRVLRP